MSHGPFRIFCPEGVSSDPGFPFPASVPPGEHEAWANDYGAVSVKTATGMLLGVRPSEFTYVTLPPRRVPLAVTPEGAATLIHQFMDAVAAARAYRELEKRPGPVGHSLEARQVLDTALAAVTVRSAP